MKNSYLTTVTACWLDSCLQLAQNTATRLILFSNIKPLTNYNECERFTGLSKGRKGPTGLGLGLGPLRWRTGTDCCSRCVICNNAGG